MTSRAQAQAIASEVLGLAVTRTDRAVDLQMFQLGHRPQSGLGEFALHIQSPWHISTSRLIVVAYGDIAYPRSDGSEDFDSDVIGSSSRDEKLESLLSPKPLVVRGIRVGRLGGLNIQLCGGLKLRTFPSTSDQEDEPEYWRLIKHGGWHLVSTTRGYTVIN